MGIGIFPVYDPPLALGAFQSDGKILAAEYELLDAIAREAGVKAFSSFGDNRPVPDDFDGDPDELELDEWDEWFDPVEGLLTVKTILSKISASPADSGSQDPYDLVDELRELERSLAIAASSGVKFRFEMG